MIHAPHWADTRNFLSPGNLHEIEFRKNFLFDFRPRDPKNLGRKPAENLPESHLQVTAVFDRPDGQIAPENRVERSAFVDGVRLFVAELAVSQESVWEAAVGLKQAFFGGLRGMPREDEDEMALMTGDEAYDLDDYSATFDAEEFKSMGINPFKSTKARPGTEEKVNMLSARYAAGLPLWHDSDCYDHGPHEMELMGSIGGIVEEPVAAELDEE